MTYDNWKATNPADAELGSMEQDNMTIPEKIIAALQEAPAGLTSRQLAKAIGKPFDSVCACASRMHSNGKLERDSVRQRRMIEHEAILWKTPKA